MSLQKEGFHRITASFPDSNTHDLQLGDGESKKFHVLGVQSGFCLM